MNTLSLYRIKHLFASYFITNWQRDLKTFLIVLAVNAFLTFFKIHIITPIIIILSIIYAGRIFQILENENSAINYLSLPANTGEKLLTNITLSVIYYPIALLATAGLGHLLGLFLAFITPEKSFIFDPSFNDPITYNNVIALLIFLSIFMFGSVYFRKNAVLKTSFCIAILFFVLLFMIFPLILYVIHGVDFSIGQSASLTYSITGYKTFEVLFEIFKYVVILFFWVLSYFRLRETEA